MAERRASSVTTGKAIHSAVFKITLATSIVGFAIMIGGFVLYDAGDCQFGLKDHVECSTYTPSFAQLITQGNFLGMVFSIFVSPALLLVGSIFELRARIRATRECRRDSSRAAGL